MAAGFPGVATLARQGSAGRCGLLGRSGSRTRRIYENIKCVLVDDNYID